MGSVHTLSLPSSSAFIPGRTLVKFMFGATDPFSNANKTLAIEQVPELDSQWPRFDFTDPTNSGVLRPLQKMLSTAVHSSGSELN